MENDLNNPCWPVKENFVFEPQKIWEREMSKNEKYVTNMKDEAVRDELIYLRDKLDELDQDDYFGTQGWEYQFGMRD
jgi:hypothetical protein